MADRSRLTADWYIAALPYHRLTPLLPERLVTHYAYFQQLSRLSESSLVMVRLNLDQSVDRTQLVLLEGKTFHWVIRHSDEERHDGATVLWAMAVDEPELLLKSNETLIQLAKKDMAAAFPSPQSPRLIEADVMRLPSALLTTKPGAQQCRPLSTSPFTNFLLAGAWTDTGWPANLESAILSGQHCADGISADAS